MTDSKQPRVEVLPIEQGATPDMNNINKHTQKGGALLNNSLRKRGAFRSIASAGKGVDVPVVGAGNFTLENAVEAGFKEVVNVHVSGDQLVNVVRDDIAPNTPEFFALAIEDNEIGKQSYNPDIDLVAAMAAGDTGILSALKENDKTFGAMLEGMGIYKERMVAAKPNPRKLALDFIYTQTFHASCCVAVHAGLKYGMQSGKKNKCGNADVWDDHKLVFIDNDYMKYNHAKHLECVAENRPKYATVRDVMSEEQCKLEGIEYFSLDQILTWAEELNKYAENVIVIPKYDCIDDIPEKFMLGYSIPTSHGGTPLPVDLFRGRRIHLLGGSFKDQMKYLTELGEDVVSVDNNYISLIAKYGAFESYDGTIRKVHDLGLLEVTNPMVLAVAISCGNIAARINEFQPKTESEEA